MSQIPFSPALTMVEDDLSLSPHQTEALIRVIEAAPRVIRRNQFFTWSQSWVGALLPHPLILCGAYDRKRREVVFEVLNSVVLPQPLISLLGRGDSALLTLLLGRWVGAQASPLVLDVTELEGGPAGDCVPMLQAGGIRTLAAHGVARPQRPSEIESFFMFGSRLEMNAQPFADHLELLLPILHSVWQRVVAREATTPSISVLGPTGRPAPVSTGDPNAGSLTPRELEILHSVRLGYRNHEIGTRLGISPLTVKNHLQKILKKLGAANRAQAVAEALGLGLLDRSEPRSVSSTPMPP